MKISTVFNQYFVHLVQTVMKDKKEGFIVASFSVTDLGQCVITPKVCRGDQIKAFINTILVGSWYIEVSEDLNKKQPQRWKTFHNVFKTLI